MKNSVKQITIWVICTIIVFIPTFIAISYYCITAYVPLESQYQISMVNENGIEIPVDIKDTDDIADMILKINTKMSPCEEPGSFPVSYYDINISEDGKSICNNRYYFSVDKDSKTIIKDSGGATYSVEFKHTKNFLLQKYAYLFYPNSSVPSLSLYGGDDILPVSAEWKFQNANGKMIKSPDCKTIYPDKSYAMRSSTTLSFSTDPQKCTVTLFDEDDKKIGKYSSLDDIPYNMLDSDSVSFKIEAEWDGSDYEGKAYYEFSSRPVSDPIFSIDEKTIKSGEIFVVTAENISAPQKIVFSSVPTINVTPTFFMAGDKAVALIPIDIELQTECNYKFSFTYGDSTSVIDVYVEERNVLTENEKYDISISRTENAIAEYKKLLNEIGLKNESSTNYFNGKFANYEEIYSFCNYDLGFGHIRQPANGDTPFRLDGVDYELDEGASVVSTCAGNVIHVGKCELLGNFVVIDHGFGLKTWYCNLSEVTVYSGTTVAEGEAIGISGSSGYKISNGVFLITTVYNIPVSPYPLQDPGITISK